jgi:hypothetical protein
MDNILNKDRVWNKIKNYIYLIVFLFSLIIVLISIILIINCFILYKLNIKQINTNSI